MKMNLFDKFLVAIILLLLLAVSLFIGCISVGLVPLTAVTGYLENLTGLWGINSLIFGGIAAVLFIVVIRLFVASYSGGQGQAYTRLLVTETGEISISVPTIRQIASTFLSGKPDLLASATDVLPTKAGLMVCTTVCIKEGALIPDVTTATQKELKAHLETITGLAIQRIVVQVDNNRSNYSGKGR